MSNMKDIAKVVGTSVCTVSLVLNGKAEERKISPATVQRILDAARELDYRPNIAARKLRTEEKPVPVIALYWATDFRVSLLARFLKGLQQVPSEGKYSLMILPFEPGKLSRQTGLTNARQFHAAVIANASAEDMDFLERTELPMPVVCYHRHPANYPYVTVDDHRMGRMAAEALKGAGKTRPVLLLSSTGHSGADEREQGFETVMAGVARLRGENSVRGGLQMGRELLDSGVTFDGLFCVSDAIALGAMQALRERGVAMPEEVAVISIGNGDQDYAAAAEPPLTCVYLPMEDMAKCCLEEVLELLGHREVETPQLVLETPLIRRKSC